MDNQAKAALLAMIRGLCVETGNQYYSSKVLKEEQIEVLIKFIKNY